VNKKLAVVIPIQDSSGDHPRVVHGARLEMRLLPTLILFSVCTVVSAQQAIKTGPEVGSTVPAFEAPDQYGREQSLQSIVGPKGALLVFYRSADW